MQRCFTRQFGLLVLNASGPSGAVLLLNLSGLLKFCDFLCHLVYVIENYFQVWKEPAFILQIGRRHVAGSLPREVGALRHGPVNCRDGRWTRYYSAAASEPLRWLHAVVCWRNKKAIVATRHSVCFLMLHRHPRRKPEEHPRTLLQSISVQAAAEATVDAVRLLADVGPTGPVGSTGPPTVVVVLDRRRKCLQCETSGDAVAVGFGIFFNSWLPDCCLCQRRLGAMCGGAFVLEMRSETSSCKLKSHFCVLNMTNLPLQKCWTQTKLLHHVHHAFVKYSWMCHNAAICSCC